MAADGDEGGAGVVELLGAVGLEAFAVEFGTDLLGEIFRPEGPVEGRGGGDGDDDVVAVKVDAAVSAEGEDDLGTPAADVGDEGSDDGVEVFLGEVAVGVVEDLMAGDAENFARFAEFFAAELSEVFVVFGSFAKVGVLAGGEADEGGIDLLLMGEQERAAEGAAFVVGVSGEAEQAAGAGGQDGDSCGLDWVEGEFWLSKRLDCATGAKDFL